MSRSRKWLPVLVLLALSACGSDKIVNGYHIKPGANLYRAELPNTELYNADLKGADLRAANLRGAWLSGANLSGANLSGANLIAADFYGADLSGANLSKANLTYANLSGANLSGANLSGANLTDARMPDDDYYEAQPMGNSDCELIFCLEDWGLIGFGLFFAIVVGIPFLIWGLSKLLDNASGPLRERECPNCGSTYLIRIPISAPIGGGPEHAGQPACGERMQGLRIECRNCGYWWYY